MREEAYRTWLKTRVSAVKTRSDQPSRVRRLEAAFGDLDDAYARDGMASLMAALDYSAADSRKNRPLPAGIVSTGKRAQAMSTLRHAAALYREFRHAMAQADIPTALVPIRSPLPTTTRRKLQPTGYWMFAARPSIWNADAWLASGARDLLYSVSPEDSGLIQIGDLGIIKRNVWRRVPSAIVALVEVIEAPTTRPDDDARFYIEPVVGNARKPRCRLAVLSELEVPLPARASPDTESFRLVRDGVQRTSTAIAGEVFQYFAVLAGVTATDVIGIRSARSPDTVRQAEALAANLTPKAQRRISRYIERGPVGAAVKAKRKNRCQICVGLGGDGVAFTKAGGGDYSEAHHVMPVAKLVAGSLAAENIMVLCPNHHRQAHYGRFEIFEETATSWNLKIDHNSLRIEKTSL